jgi:hypothetical protein
MAKKFFDTTTKKKFKAVKSAFKPVIFCTAKVAKAPSTGLLKGTTYTAAKKQKRRLSARAGLP